MAAVAAPAAVSNLVEFNPARNGRFKVLVGDSIKSSQDDASSSLTTFRYNTMPPSNNSKRLTRSDNGQFELSYNDKSETVYSGIQRPGRKLECVLVYNPKDNAFTLERLSSAFTFNQVNPSLPTAAIPTTKITQDDEIPSDDEDAQVADVENPFDIKHFTGKVAQQQGSNSDDDEDERKETGDEDYTDVDMEDADGTGGVGAVSVSASRETDRDEQEMVMTPSASVSTPVPAPSSTGATPISTTSLGPAKRKSAKREVNPFMKPVRKTKPPPANAKSPLLHPGASAGSLADDRKESSMSPRSALPSPMHLDSALRAKPLSRKPAQANKNTSYSSSSDEDSSDDDSHGNNNRAHPRRQPQQTQAYHKNVSNLSREPSHTDSIFSNQTADVIDLPNPSHNGRHCNNDDNDEDGDVEDEEADDDDIWAQLEDQFSAVEDEDPITIEGIEPPNPRFGLGIEGVNTGEVAPVSLRGPRDESEESSEEE